MEYQFATMIKILVFFIVVSHALSQQQEGCLIDITQLNYPQPIIVRGYTYDFIYPPPENDLNTRSIYLSWGDIILIACPGGTLNLPNQPELVYASCNTHSQLIIQSETINFTSLICNTQARTDSTLRTGVRCGTGELIKVGYQLEDVPFITLQEVCFDLGRGSALYARFNMTKSIHNQENISPIFFEDDADFYRFQQSSDEVYNGDNARKTLNKQVGLDDNNQKYIKFNGFYREMLSSNVEMFYSFQKIASFRAINSFPQWPFDCSNFDYLYYDVRRYAYKNQVDLEVITGTYGVTTLPHEITGELVEIYLYVDGGIKSLPIPALSWRVVYEPVAKKALAFITVNSPFDYNILTNIVCQDIAPNITWTTWNSGKGRDNYNASCGYSYACDYWDFKKVISYVPELDVVDILN